MILAKEFNYEGWRINTNCDENKPVDWKPFDKISYTARANIKLLHPDQFKHLWSVTAARIPETGERDFNNDIDAHSVLKAEAKALIDTWKK